MLRSLREMTYFKCKWNHTFPDEPIMLYRVLNVNAIRDRGSTFSSHLISPASAKMFQSCPM